MFFPDKARAAAVDFAQMLRPLPSRPAVVVLELEGPVTSQNAVEFRERLGERIGPRDLCLVLAFRGVSYLSSVGLGFLVEAAGELERRGGALFLVDLPAKVKLVIENLGVGRYFRIAPDLDAARSEAAALADRGRPAPRLVSLRGGREIPITDAPVVVGADCEVRREGDRCLLAAKTPVWVGDRRVQQKALQAGDVVRIGDARWMFVPGT